MYALNAETAPASTGVKRSVPKVQPSARLNALTGLSRTQPLTRSLQAPGASE